MHICVSGLASCGGSGLLTTCLCSRRVVDVCQRMWSGPVVVAIWNECVHSMRGGVVYTLCGWSVVRPMASLTDVDSHTGDCSQPSRECEAVDSEKDLGF